MGNERAEQLIRKYLEGTATPEEEALLESWYIDTSQDRSETVRDQPALLASADYDKIRDEILQRLRADQQHQPKPDQQGADQSEATHPIRLWPRVAVAAAVLILLSVGGLFIFRKAPPASVAQRQPLENDILPAGTSATLTLPDGRKIALDSTGSHTLARQGSTTIRTLDGQLIYSPDGPGQPAAAGTPEYNTLTTRPGEHYSVVLPDGTKIWLNAASSITYPVVFNANQRKVTASGEVYFEIAHRAAQPFTIAVRNELIEDIGTHLNINAYDDEATISTTLLEGRIKVSKGSASAILTPGQQSTIRPDDSSFQLRTIDADAAIAWKNGYFLFDRADLKSVMRELARWYNVQVVYKGDLPKKTFKGKLYRNINASEALRILTYFGAHFAIDGRTITVSS